MSENIEKLIFILKIQKLNLLENQHISYISHGGIEYHEHAGINNYPGMIENSSKSNRAKKTLHIIQRWFCYVSL